MQFKDYVTTKMSKLLTTEEPLALEQQQKELIMAVNDARQEWYNAQNLFDHAEDPDLIDHAIFALEAAQKKYVYLHKKAKEMGLLQEQESANRVCNY